MNIVTQIWHLHSIYTENILDNVHIIKYRHFMNALHNVSINSKTIRNKQTHDKSILEYNKTFDVTVQHEIGRG